jgi:hypothetical protein
MTAAPRWRAPLLEAIGTFSHLDLTKARTACAELVGSGWTPRDLWRSVAVLLSVFSRGYSQGITMAACRRIPLDLMVRHLVVRYFYGQFFVGRPPGSEAECELVSPVMLKLPLGAIYGDHSFPIPAVQGRLLGMVLHRMSLDLGLLPDPTWAPGLTPREDYLPPVMTRSAESIRSHVLGPSLAQVGNDFNLLYAGEGVPVVSSREGGDQQNHRAALADGERLDHSCLPPCIAKMAKDHLGFPERSTLLFFLRHYSSSEEHLRELAAEFSGYETLRENVRSVWKSPVKGTSCQFVMSRGCCAFFSETAPVIDDIEDTAASLARRACFSHSAPGYNPGAVYNTTSLYSHLREKKTGQLPRNAMEMLMTSGSASASGPPLSKKGKTGEVAGIVPGGEKKK